MELILHSTRRKKTFKKTTIFYVLGKDTKKDIIECQRKQVLRPQISCVLKGLTHFDLPFYVRNLTFAGRFISSNKWNIVCSQFLLNGCCVAFIV